MTSNPQITDNSPIVYNHGTGSVNIMLRMMMSVFIFIGIGIYIAIFNNAFASNKGAVIPMAIFALVLIFIGYAFVFFRWKITIDNENLSQVKGILGFAKTTRYPLTEFTSIVINSYKMQRVPTRYRVYFAGKDHAIYLTEYTGEDPALEHANKLSQRFDLEIKK